MTTEEKKPEPAAPAQPQMRCYICDSVEQFHSMGHFSPRAGVDPRELLVCKPCGNICYRVDPSTEAKMLDFYRYGYRPAPTSENIRTTENKKNYIRLFLKEILEARNPKKTGKPMTTVDIGCATGYVPNFLRKLGHRATGTEYTVQYRRMAEHFYGIPITEQVEKKRKYDLITIYHVLEHMMEPDKKLADFTDCLAEDGRMMVSVPEWLNACEEASGQEMKSFEHLFHVDHINVFTEQSMKNIIAKCGLMIEKENRVTYGQTYMLRRATPEEKAAAKIVVENWEKVVADILRCKAAIEAYQKRDYRTAIGLWPKFPEAHLTYILDVNGKDPAMQAQMFEEIKPILGENVRVKRAVGIWLYRNARHKEAITVFEDLMNVRPTADILVWLAWCYAETGNHKASMGAMQRAAAIDPTKWSECMNWILEESVKVPTWDERARNEYADQIVSKAMKDVMPVLTDHFMDPEPPKPAQEAAPAAPQTHDQAAQPQPVEAK